jgi:hypothetical protein
LILNPEIAYPSVACSEQVAAREAPIIINNFL